MIWLILTVVLLIVLHPRFRRVTGWLSLSAVLVGAAVAAYVFHNRSPATTTTAAVAVDAPQCPPGERPAKDNLTSAASCYNPHDAAQLAEHLKECAPLNVGGRYTTVADRRNVPCNPFDQFDNDCPSPPATPWPGCTSRDAEPWNKYRRAGGVGSTQGSANNASSAKE